jgi:hypothetical protein
MIMAIKAKVAFQTIFHTTGISATVITPNSKAIPAPILAVQPMPKPLGCHITNIKVTRKMSNAVIIDCL